MKKIWITTPNGRSFYGRAPEDVVTSGEGPYIRSLAVHVRGVAEFVLPCGRADVATATHIFEVEPAHQWRHGGHQAFAYSAMTGCIPVLALFGPNDYENIYVRIRDRVKAGLELWAFDGLKWHAVTSRALAKQIGPRIARAERQVEREKVAEQVLRDAPGLWEEDKRYRAMKRALREPSLYDLASEV